MLPRTLLRRISPRSRWAMWTTRSRSSIGTPARPSAWRRTAGKPPAAPARPSPLARYRSGVHVHRAALGSRGRSSAFAIGTAARRSRRSQVLLRLRSPGAGPVSTGHALEPEPSSHGSKWILPLVRLPVRPPHAGASRLAPLPFVRSIAGPARGRPVLLRAALDPGTFPDLPRYESAYIGCSTWVCPSRLCRCRSRRTTRTCRRRRRRSRTSRSTRCWG